MTVPDQPAPRPLETSPQTLRRLMAEGGWSTRKLSRATEALGRRFGNSSIGNIARGDDRPSVEALTLLAQAMGHAPEVFLDVRLARVQRLFDARDPAEGGVGPAAAAENYTLMTAIFPQATAVSARLSESPAVSAAETVLEQALRDEAQRSRGQAPGASAGEGSPPPAEEPPPAQAKRRRRRSA
jgi:transcriptional regulator with XRE-family HTH domain